MALSVLQISQMSDMLKTAPQRYDDLMLVCGKSKQSVAVWIRKMRDAKLVRIAGYATDMRGRLFMPCFAWGGEPDAARPGLQRNNPAERMRKTRARRAANGSAK